MTIVKFSWKSWKSIVDLRRQMPQTNLFLAFASRLAAFFERSRFLRIFTEVVRWVEGVEIEIQICPPEASPNIFCRRGRSAPKTIYDSSSFCFLSNDAGGVASSWTTEEERNSWQPPDVCPSVYRRSEIQRISFGFWLFAVDLYLKCTFLLDLLEMNLLRRVRKGLNSTTKFLAGEIWCQFENVARATQPPMGQKRCDVTSQVSPTVVITGPHRLYFLIYL